MIGKLQRKFVLVAMFVAIVVTTSIYSFIAFENYRIADKRADFILDLISKNNGEMPEYESHQDYSGYITRETQYSIRYFSVKVTERGDLITSNMSSIASISPDDLGKIIKDIGDYGQNMAYYGSYT